MSSPNGKQRPLSTSGYEPLIPLQPHEGKPKPPPKPKPQFLKSFSSSAISSGDEICLGDGISSNTSRDAGGYFQPGGGTGIGYCLSSVHKTRKTTSESGNKGEDSTSSPKVQDHNKLKFVCKDNSSRPPLMSLPAKFRFSFEERNRQSLHKPGTPDPDTPVTGILVPISEPVTDILVPISEPVTDILVPISEPVTDILVPISESDCSIVRRRPPPPIPRNSANRMSNPLPINPFKSLPAHRNSCNIPSIIDSNLTSSLERDSSDGSESSMVSQNAPSPASPSPASPRPARPITFAQPPPRQMDYVEKEHPWNSFEYLEKFRQRGELCDATLIVDGKELKSHRVVLAASSQYFESMFIGEFAEPSDEPIVIEELSEDALEAMIAFAYTSHIKITEKNVYSVFEAADLLQFNRVKGACFKFFKQQINKSNCIQTWLFAETHNCIELLEAALKYIDYNFPDIVKGKEFLGIDQPEDIIRITSREDLAITSEEQVYEAVLAWVRNKLEKRRKYSHVVFKCVRFPSMSKDYLLRIVDNEPLIKEDPDLLQLLIDALESHVTTMRGTLRKKKKMSVSMENQNMRPRASSIAVEVVQVYRQNSVLGLRIMGGVNHPQHVFRQGDKPGIFILQMMKGSAVAKIGRLRQGDRIIQVNDVDMTKVTHEEAIRVLKIASEPLSFYVRHEPVPAGLKEVTLVTKPGEGFGFVLVGGVNGYFGNPFDDTDEGIFLSQIIPGGAAEQDGRLKVGTRILQINSVSMLGKTRDDALKVLQGVLDRLNLLICDGYDPSAIARDQDVVSLENDAFL